MRQNPAAALAGAVLLALGLAANLMAADMDGVMKSGGKMMMMHKGKPAGPMEKEMTMSNGIRVEPDGSVKMKDGTTRWMKNGQLMMMDGHVMEGGKAMGMHY